jgi:hypothetical protein
VLEISVGTEEHVYSAKNYVRIGTYLAGVYIYFHWLYKNREAGKNLTKISLYQADFLKELSNENRGGS